MAEPESLSERIITPLSAALVTAIDDYRFSNRVPSRAEAMRQLLQRGLANPTSSAPETPGLSDLVLKYYSADPARLKVFDKGAGVKTAQHAFDFEMLPPTRRSHRDPQALYALVELAKIKLAEWEDIDDPTAQTIAALLRPLTL